MIHLFLKKGKGSISVFVVAIMVPVIFFIGFLVDLARIKFCGTNAVMAADNYGEAILTDYDNLLKELYGLFALTQNKEGKAALDRLDAYVKTYYTTSLQPDKSRINPPYLQGWADTKAYEGWKPYQNAVIHMSAEPVPGASLATPEVFNTQIGDFMKFRIVQAVGDDGDALTNALSSVKNMEKNMEAVDKRTELADKASEALSLALDYYVELEAFAQYPDYITDINQTYQTQTAYMSSVINNYYETYMRYMQAVDSGVDFEKLLERKREAEEAENKEKEENDKNKEENKTEENKEEENTEENENNKEETENEEEEKVAPLSEEEKALLKIYDDYVADNPYNTEDMFEQYFYELSIDPVEAYIEREGLLATAYLLYDSAGDTRDIINFTNFDSKVEALQNAADNMYAVMEELATVKGELDEILKDSSVSEDLKNGIREELEKVDKLFGTAGEYYSAEQYYALAYDMEQNKTKNEAYATQMQAMLDSMKTVAEQCITQHVDVEDISDYAEALGDPVKEENWWDFTEDSTYKHLYESLKECFGDVSVDSKKAQDKQDKADGLLNKVGDKLDNEETPDCLRDIPNGFHMGDERSAAGFDILKMIKEAGNCFSMEGLANNVNRLWTKLYLTQYDFGMFTSRVTNIKKKNAPVPSGTGGDSGEEEVKESLTGYPMAANINYLYQAEIEYLLGGHNSSKENLNDARNKILAFRAGMNFAATYTVKELNDMINAVAELAVHPLLVLVVNGALRLAVAGVETYADWTLLKDGESVCVLKKKMGDLSILALPEDLAGDLGELLDGRSFNSSQKSNSLKLNYEQYLLIMMVFLTPSEDLSRRTGDLVALNVNTVKQEVGSKGTLERLTFKMEDTVTAVNATCSVQIDMVVMPKGFAKAVVSEDLFQAINDFEKTTYKFTVTRGY